MHKARSSTSNDVDRIKDALQKLKSENRKLRKENSRLRKQLSRHAESEFDREVDSEEEVMEAIGSVVEEVIKDALYCPKCQSGNFTIIPAGKYSIKACRSCGYRKRSEVKD